MLWMLCCDSAVPSTTISPPSSYLFLELLVDFVAICTTSLLRIIIDPVPKYTVIFFRVSVTRPLRRLHDGPNAPDVSFRGPDLVIIKVF